MAIDPSIYQLLDTKGLQSGLQGIAQNYLAGQEHTARLSNLARQNELQDLQINAAKRAEAAIPQQQADAQRQREAVYMQGVSREIAQAPENADAILQKHAAVAAQMGIDPTHITWLASDLLNNSNSLADIRSRAMYHANPQEAEKAFFAQQKPTTPSPVAQMIKDYETATGTKMPIEEQARIYKQGLETKTTPQPFMQALTGEGGAQMLVTAPKSGGKATVQNLGITKPSKGPTPEEKAMQLEQASLSSQQVLDQAEKLFKHPGRQAGTGASSWLSVIPGTEAKGFATNLETLKSQTFLPMVQALKGMGALSDAEGKKISASVGALDPQMPEAEFENSLKEVTQFLYNKGKAAGLNITLPEFAGGKGKQQQQGGAKFLGFE